MPAFNPFLTMKSVEGKELTIFFGAFERYSLIPSSQVLKKSNTPADDIHLGSRG
jgi:hypothetical protein